MRFTISKNQGSGRTVITVTPEEKNSTDKDIVQILTVEEMPSHTHSYNKIRIETHKWGDNANNRPHPFYDSGAQTGPTGGNQPHENRPPYYVLAYVMKVR